MSKRKRTYKKMIAVPIYDARVWVIVSDDISKERNKWDYLWGPGPKGDYAALCSYGSGPSHGLFFGREAINLKLVAHEVFHATHRIMDWVGANFDSTHHEQAALLNAWLMVEVVNACKLAGDLNL